MIGVQRAGPAFDLRDKEERERERERERENPQVRIDRR
jgi:hypothetical protein